VSPRRLGLALFLLLLPFVGARLRGADEIEYFAYLRSLSFDHDLDFTNEYTYFSERDPQGLLAFRQTFLERREDRTGRPINFAPLGTAVLWSPFYGSAHLGVLAARASGAQVAADGYSAPYLWAIGTASLFWGCLGLALVQRALVSEFGIDKLTSGLTVVAIGLGTPALYYLTVAPGFSHACSLFVVAGLLSLWLHVRRDEPGRLLHWAALGFLGGLCALVREQDGFFLAVPAFDLALRAVRRRRLAPEFGRGVLLVALAALAFAPQLLAYRALNGSFGPSPLVQRKMNWASPHFFEVLFDPAHGLFFWSPLLLLASLGLVWSCWRRKDERTALLALGLLLQVFLNGAVESWSLAGAFGSRRFVGATFVFACGLAPVLGAFRGVRARVLLAVLAVWWNVSLMVQFGLKLMDRQGLDWPRVAQNQFQAVPARLARTAWLYLTDRERLVQETR